MIAVDFHVRGSAKAARLALERSDPAVLKQQVFDPWVQWVLHKRIPQMYWAKGRVGGADGQMPWPALSKWTIASKGVMSYLGESSRRGSSLAPMTTYDMKMAKSYHIDQHRVSSNNWLFMLSNAARSTSRWSPGFDYPSVLHTGWGPYTVRPRPGNKRGLAWPMKRGTVVTAAMGRETWSGSAGVGGFGWERYIENTIKRGKNKGKTRRVSLMGNRSVTKEKYARSSVRRATSTVASDWARAMETHPQGAPPRPHIKWFRIDVIELGRRQINFITTGRPAQAAA